MAPRLLVPLLGAALAAAAGCAPAAATMDHSAHMAHMAGAGEGPGDGDGPAQGSAASDFSLRDTDGRTVRLSDYAGKVVLIDFWATWCTPCQAEIPHLESMYQAHKDRGFVVLGVAMDGPETIANVSPLARSLGISYPVLLDEETKVVAIYNPKRSAPLAVLIDRQGRIVRVRQGYNVGDEAFIADDVQKLLGP